MIKMSTTISGDREAHMWVSDEFIIVRIGDDICFVPQVWRWLTADRVLRLSTALTESAQKVT